MREETPLPFSRLYRPLADIICTGQGYARRKILELHRETQNPQRGKTVKRMIRTRSGIVEVLTINDPKPSLFATLTISPRMRLVGREIVLGDIALPDVMLSACQGMRLRDVADPGETFPGRDAIILNARRVVRTTRLLIGIEEAQIHLEDIPRKAA